MPDMPSTVSRFGRSFVFNRRGSHVESNPRLDRLRQQAGDLAENMGTQWADYVAAAVKQWTDGGEQSLFDRGAELVEMLCADHLHTFPNDAHQDRWAAPRQ